MNDFLIETERLVMKPFSPKDAVHLFKLNCDPRVLEHTGDKAFNTIMQAEDFLRNYDQFTKYKMGRFSVFNKNNLRYLGWSGLRYTRETDRVDLGFRLAHEYWGNGYATESASAFLDYGFNQLALKKIIARARKSNVNSIRVLEKLEMTLIKEFDFEGYPGVLYEIGNNKFKTAE